MINQASTHVNDVFKLSKEETLKTFYERMITIPITSIMALKKELATTVGKDRSKGIFTRYGWHNGVSDGKKVMALKCDNELDLIKSGSKLHMLHGYVDRVVIDGIDYDEEEGLEAIHVSWYNSFEADEHVISSHESDQPVCHTMCGYVSGYLSTVLKRTIIVMETTCSAVGDDHCEVICLPKEKCGEELKCEFKYYQSTSIIQELDEITAKFKKERDDLSKTYDIHKRLISELLAKKGLQRMVDVIYQKTGMATFIENEDNQIIAKSNEITCHFELEKLHVHTTSFIEISPEIGVLRTPIYLEQQVKGYCSFIFHGDKKPKNLDYMIIDQVSLTAAIILLSDNIKINTEQNIKRSFLNDILDGNLEEEELYRIARYLQFDPNDNYWMLTIERSIHTSHLNDEIETNEALMRHIHLFFRERQINIIVSQNRGNIFILIENSSFKKSLIKQTTLIKQLFKQVLHRFRKDTFYAGVSSLVQNIDQVPILHEETLAALKAKKPDNHILYFEDLGIESVLFQIPDEALINRFVEKQIGELLKMDKDHELMKTFYAYIENGININHTAKAISMSISGLRYRLARISDILELDYDDTKSVFSAYMALNILVAKGKITM